MQQIPSGAASLPRYSNPSSASQPAENPGQAGAFLPGFPNRLLLMVFMFLIQGSAGEAELLIVCVHGLALLFVNHPAQIHEIKAAERENPSLTPRLTSWQQLPCFALVSPFDSPGCILLLNYHLITQPWHILHGLCSARITREADNKWLCMSH